MDAQEYELFGYKVIFYKNINGEYKIGSLTMLSALGFSQEETERRINKYIIVLEFVVEKLKELNSNQFQNR